MKVLQVLAVLSVALSSYSSSAQAISSEQLFNQAVTAQKTGDNRTALKCYEILVRKDPKNVAVRVNLAGLLMDLGKLDQAITNFQAGLHLDPANLDLRLGLDAAWTSKDDPGSLQSAVSDLERLHKESPDNLTASLMLADAEAHQQKFALALTILQPLEPQMSDSDDFEFLLGRAMLETGESVQGVARMELAATRSGRMDAFLAAGRARLNMSQFDLAKKDAEVVILKQPDMPGANTLLGTTLTRMGDYDGAITILKKAIAQDPNDFDANYGLGSVLYFHRDLQASLPLLEHALSLRPKSSEARYKLALLQQTLGRTPIALMNLEIVTHERPEWAEPHAKLSALYFQLHRPEDGERQLRSLEALQTETKLAPPNTP